MVLIHPKHILDAMGITLTRLMFHIFLGATYSPSSPLELHYSDSTSSIHPDRPIRPLPKRRLRSRLSADVAESILYPVAATSPSQPLLQYPYRGLLGDKTGELSGKAVNLREGPTNGDEDSDSYQFRGNVVYSDDEEPSGVARRYQEQRQRLAGMNTFSKNGYTVPRTVASKYMKPPIPQSTASSGDSVDGYESFENTNNKKKRKIPTSGSLGNHHTSLSTDMAQMGISSSRGIEVLQAESDTVVGHYYGTGHSAAPAVSLQPGTGLSGPGRGRYGRAGPRHRSGRSPLGVSLNGSNTSHASRSLHHRRDHPSSDIIGGKDIKSFRHSVTCLSNQ